MDWYLFWTAFGAVGTTLGSLLTALAVFIALKQYLQPTTKRIVITMGTMYFKDGAQICINIKNCGIRDVTIEYVSLKAKKYELSINMFQSPINNPPSLPFLLHPEDIYRFHVEHSILKVVILNMIQEKLISIHGYLTVNVHDSLGAKHYCKQKIKVRDFLQ